MNDSNQGSTGLDSEHLDIFADLRKGIAGKESAILPRDISEICNAEQ